MIDLFPPKPKVTPEQSQRIKDWIYQILQINSNTVISLSQLKCQDPNCPPLQTAIAIMTDPHRVIRIHKAAVDITYGDVIEAIASIAVSNKS